MKYGLSDEKLQILLDELGEEYKDLLVSYILDDTGIIDPDQIKCSELIKIDTNIKDYLRLDRKTRQRKRTIAMIMMMGVLYALLGLFLLLFSYFYPTAFKGVEIVALFISFCGIFMTGDGIILSELLKKRSWGNSYKISPYDILSKWKEFELVISRYTKGTDRFSFLDAVDQLRKDDVLTSTDMRVLETMRQMRNEIVHKENLSKMASQNELRMLFNDMDTIIQKVRSR